LNALSGWQWLLPTEFTVWLMNRFGDLFLILPDGSVHMLDIGAGSLTKLAESRDDFARIIDEDDNADDWLMIPLVDGLVATGVNLQPGQCNGMLIPILVRKATSTVAGSHWFPGDWHHRGVIV
jgi:hypothetical protein